MNATKFTPAPWHIEPGDSGDHSVGLAPTPTTVEHDPDGDGNVVTICRVSDPVRRTNREPANEFDECLEWIGSLVGNAALIAAAPDLYAACKALIDAARPSSYIFSKMVRAIELAEAAVAKAEGREEDAR